MVFRLYELADSGKHCANVSERLPEQHPLRHHQTACAVKQVTPFEIQYSPIVYRAQ